MKTAPSLKRHFSALKQWVERKRTLFIIASNSLSTRRSRRGESLCSNSRVRPCCSWDTKILSPVPPPSLCLKGGCSSTTTQKETGQTSGEALACWVRTRESSSGQPDTSGSSQAGHKEGELIRQSCLKPSQSIGLHNLLLTTLMGSGGSSETQEAFPSTCNPQNL